MGEKEGDKEGVLVGEVLEEGVRVWDGDRDRVGEEEGEGEREARVDGVKLRVTVGLPLRVLPSKLRVKVGVRDTPEG